VSFKQSSELRVGKRGRLYLRYIERQKCSAVHLIVRFIYLLFVYVFITRFIERLEADLANATVLLSFVRLLLRFNPAVIFHI
jgi:uncharacterized membrane protein